MDKGKFKSLTEFSYETHIQINICILYCEEIIIPSNTEVKRRTATIKIVEKVVSSFDFKIDVRSHVTARTSMRSAVTFILDRS